MKMLHILNWCNKPHDMLRLYMCKENKLLLKKKKKMAVEITESLQSITIVYKQNQILKYNAVLKDLNNS